MVSSPTPHLSGQSIKMSVKKRLRASLAFGSSSKALGCMLCMLGLPFCLRAQQNKLVVSPAEQVTAKRGSTVVQHLQVTVLPGFHVNNDKPKDEFLIPLKLTWTDGPLEAKSI